METGMKAFFRSAVLGGCTLILAACQTVEFESPPSLPLAACDPIWVGDWRIENLRSDREVVVGQEQFLRVDKSCKEWTMVEIRPGQDGMLEIEVDDMGKEQELGFAKSEKHTVLALRERADPNAQDAKDDKPEGYVLLSYAPSDKQLLIREADLKVAARLVIDDLAPGWVEKRDRNSDGSQGAFSKSFWVYLFGAAESTAALLDGNDLFTTDAARLTPLTAPDSARLNSALSEAARRKALEATTADDANSADDKR